jgi:hypothetical protein
MNIELQQKSNFIIVCAKSSYVVNRDATVNMF